MLESFEYMKSTIVKNLSNIFSYTLRNYNMKFFVLFFLNNEWSIRFESKFFDNILILVNILYS